MQFLGEVGFFDSSHRGLCVTKGSGKVRGFSVFAVSTFLPCVCLHWSRPAIGKCVILAFCFALLCFSLSLLCDRTGLLCAAWSARFASYPVAPSWCNAFSSVRSPEFLADRNETLAARDGTKNLPIIYFRFPARVPDARAACEKSVSIRTALGPRPTMQAVEARCRRLAFVQKARTRFWSDQNCVELRRSTRRHESGDAQLRNSATGVRPPRQSKDTHAKG
ncbi:hypothetical protein TGRUB_356550 [Toxoplasma gondii RUB]|uniref:Uncharacterized protein n=2 Tax=Toxoplasma gondii TaxID=5811 RepID=A0A086LNQ3_TOXGO|nr:hypothetical protein TGP89_356550 [Toxoplasma gondii p89]KFG58271.1 hypothetical protein TGRUB_356550 [Toxoplasma gondii RUB]